MPTSVSTASDTDHVPLTGKRGFQKSATFAPLFELGFVGEEFARLLLRGQQCVIPKPQIILALAQWLSRALTGEQSTIISCVWPAFAYDEEGRYTFDNVSGDIDLVGKRVQASLPAFDAFGLLHRLSLSFVVPIADYEADNSATLTRVGHTLDEFVGKLRSSQRAIRALVGQEGVSVEVPFITKLGNWYDTLAMAHSFVERGSYTGALEFSSTEMDEVLATRRSLYQRWWGYDVDVRAVLLRQVAEYGALGTILTSDTKRYPNPLLLTADSYHMAPFMQGMSTVVRPQISLRRESY